MNTTIKPSKRTSQSIVYDPIQDQIVLFGGYTDAGNYTFRTLDDTWVFDFDTLSWIDKTNNLSPAARGQSGMVYDASNGQILLFGGSSTGPLDFFDDLWSLDPSTYRWFLINNSLGVREMGLPNLDYVVSSDSMILTGGYSQDNSLRVSFYENTWELTLVNSTNKYLTINFAKINMPLVLLVIGGSLGVITIIVYKKKYQ